MNEEVTQVENLKVLIVQALEDMKARDIKVLDVRRLTDVTDFMIVASGTSDRHVKSMAIRVRDDVRDQAQVRPIGVEGENQGEWVLIDLGDIVVHLMRPETREFYDLERLWNRDVEELVRLNREKPD